MAFDDMEVIIFKVLTYLYACLKQGKAPRFEDIQSNSRLLDIPEAYWIVVMQEMIRKELIGGVRVIPTKSGPTFSDNGIHITLEGVNYLSENEGMKKAKKFLGETFLSVVNGLACGIASRNY